MERAGVNLQLQAIRDHPDAVLVTIDGSVDPKSVNRFKDELQAFATRGTKRFVLDCSKLTYINSSGLAYLLNLVGGVKAKEGMVAMVNVHHNIVLIFDMMGITALFQFYSTVEEVVQEMDEKLASELRDVGPALRLEEPPPPPPPTPALPPPSRPHTDPAPSTRRLRSGTSRMPLSTSRPRPQSNGFVRFLRSLFGLGDSSSGTTRLRRKRH